MESKHNPCSIRILNVIKKGDIHIKHIKIDNMSEASMATFLINQLAFISLTHITNILVICFIYF